ncbi:hypothetical protein GPECTOR_1g679 [Gonium pectorale]|uniref:glycerophosphodiester phosphodiesterase n=1 Tax=Gonium pectorale TaxID=33097 RepID=A0A150H3X1_GONPE|nr:hypothetical protein GPECTOR_1g679 [Gonium pectorale]|eukprot:KXZ56753.1 hypothetical protein GPECTOR_1g679 [Gonium pectorale]
MIVPGATADQASGSPTATELSINPDGMDATGGGAATPLLEHFQLADALLPQQHQQQQIGALPRPFGIAHRGASAELPEHTREAYELAVVEGADFIECDVVLTADLVPLCRHEPNLLGSTDAADKFPDRLRSYTIDGKNVTGIFSVDLTAAEVATLRAMQPWPFRNQSYNGQFRVATLADYLHVARSANRSVGIYPETKHPGWTNAREAVRSANTSLEAILLDALAAAGWDMTAPLGSEAWRARPLFLQSFEVTSLRAMAARTRAPMVLLLGDWEGWTAPDSALTLAQLTEEASLAAIATWAAAVGPVKGTLVRWEPSQPQAAQPGSRAGGSAGSGAGGGDGGAGGRYVSSGLVERFHAHGLQVHTYTLRPESRFFLPHLAEHCRLQPPNLHVGAEYELLGRQVVRVDGLFADHMPSFLDWREHPQQQHQQAVRDSPLRRL